MWDLGSPWNRLADLTNVHDIDEAVTQHIGDGRTYQSIEDGEAFRATFESPRDLVYVFLPGRSTQRRMVRHIERIAVWRKWLEGKSFDPKEYEDIGKNTTFLLSMLKEVQG